MSHGCLKKGTALGMPTHLAGCCNIYEVVENREKLDLTLPCVSLIADLIKLFEYINGMKTERHRIFNALRKLN